MADESTSSSFWAWQQVSVLGLATRADLDWLEKLTARVEKAKKASKKSTGSKSSGSSKSKK